MTHLGKRYTYMEHLPKQFTVEGIVIACETEPGYVMSTEDGKFESIRLTLLKDDGTKHTTSYFADYERPIANEEES